MVLLRFCVSIDRKPSSDTSKKVNGSASCTVSKPLQHTEVAPHERQLHHRQETAGQLLEACGDPPVLLEPPHHALHHIALSVGGSAESRRTPTPPASGGGKNSRTSCHCHSWSSYRSAI